MEQITYKQVLNSEGSLEALELWQGNSYITISFAAKGTHRSGYRWSEIKEVIDELSDRAKVQAGAVTPGSILDLYHKNQGVADDFLETASDIEQ